MPKNEKNTTRLFTDDESEIISQNFSKFANALQTSANLVQRQFFHNFGLTKLYDKKDTKVDAKTMLSGLPARFAYNVAVTYPILHIRKVLEKEGSPKYLINLAAVGIDSTVGTILELKSSEALLKKLGVNITNSQLLKMTSFSFIPFALGNSITWGVINQQDSESVITNAAAGSFAGGISTPLRNLGMSMVENSVGNSFSEAAQNTVKHFASNPRLLVAGFVPRVAAMAISKIFLSPKTTEFFEELTEEILRVEVPSKSPQTFKSKKDLAISQLDATKGSESQRK